MSRQFEFAGVNVGKTIQQIAADSRKNERLDAVRHLCGAIIKTDEFDQAVKAARVDGKYRLDKLTILVRSKDASDNLSDELARRNATSHKLGPCRVTKVAGTTGGVQTVRFQELDSDRYVTVIKPVGSDHWKVYGTYKAPSGRGAGARTRGHGADRGTT